MKKLYVSLAIFAIFIPLLASNNKNSDSTALHYVANLTGRTIILNFYAKNPFTGKSTWVDSTTIGPLLIAGNAPSNLFNRMNANLMPQQVDMHPTTCFKITVNAFSLTDKKLKDPHISSVSIPTPATSLMPNDFQITLQGDQLIVTQMPTCMGVNFGGGKRIQWPSKEDLTLAAMSPEQKITTLQQKNIALHNEITKLKARINKLKKESGITNKINNRRKMIANKYQLIEINKKTIAKLEEQIAAAKTTPDTQAKDEKPSNDSTDSN